MQNDDEIELKITMNASTPFHAQANNKELLQKKSLVNEIINNVVTNAKKNDET